MRNGGKVEAGLLKDMIVYPCRNVRRRVSKANFACMWFMQFAGAHAFQKGPIIQKTIPLLEE